MFNKEITWMNMNKYIVSTVDIGGITGHHFCHKFWQMSDQSLLHYNTCIDFEVIRCLECNNVCLFVLLLYVPSQQLWSLRDGQFT